MTISASVSAARLEQANEALAEAGHGPENFTVPLSQGASQNTTHYGFHAWDDDDFIASVNGLNIPSLQFRRDAGMRVNFDDHLVERGLNRRSGQGNSGGGRK